MKTSRTSGCRVGLWAVGLLALAGAFGTAWGQTVTNTWTNTTDGVFSHADNWDLGTPTTDHGLWFTLTDTYKVTFDENATVQWAELYGTGSDVTWDLDSRTFTLTASASSGYGTYETSIQLRDRVNLTVSNGTLHARGYNLSRGLLLLTGSDTVVNTTHGSAAWGATHGLWAVAGATAEVRIAAGAVVTNAGLRLGNQAGLNILRVTGEDSRLIVPGSVEWGRASARVEVHAEDGGEIQWNGAIFNNNASTTSTLDIHLDGGTLAVANDMVWYRGELNGNPRPNYSALHYTLYAEAYGPGMTVGGTMDLGTNTFFHLTLDNEMALEMGEIYTVAQAGTWSGLFLDGDGNIITDGAILANWKSMWEEDLALQANYTTDNKFTLTVIPEPGALTLLGLAGLGLVWMRRRRV